MPITYQRILCCTDFSEEADYAREVAWDLAKRHQASLYCLHVIPLSYRFFPEADGEEVNTSPAPAVVEKAEARLRGAFRGKGSVANRPVEFAVRWGVPFVEIIRFGRERQTDCIVLGASGSSNVRRIAYGSTAENVARRAHCSVWITRRPESGY